MKNKKQSSSTNRYHELLLTAESFCAYRERCSYELRQKMKELEADEKTTDEIIQSLQEDDYLNDERFARLFVSGKFRIKHWGKNKIRAELRMKKIADPLIYDALDSIDTDEYIKTIEHLMIKKSREIKAKNAKDKARKIAMYLLSKGFESELVWKSLKFAPSLQSE